MNKYKEEEDAIVLFSGGQDSTTSLFWAKKRFRNVSAICIDYGQRHITEVENAKRIASMANIPIEVFDATFFANLAPNSLTCHEVEIDKTNPEDKFPNTFVPGRNMIFITLISAIAYARNIRHIVTGVSEADFSGYPDCRETFILSLNTTLNLAMDKHFKIHTPLMWLNKSEIWQLSDELGVFDLVREETITCYNGIKADGCHTCPACLLRQKGLDSYLSIRK